MTDDAPRIIDIDRLVLTGIDLPPDRLARVRNHLPREIAALLAAERALDGIDASRALKTATANLDLTRPLSDREIAHGIARSLVRTVRANASPPRGRQSDG